MKRAFILYLMTLGACAPKSIPLPESTQTLEQKIIVKNSSGRFSFLSLISRSGNELTVQAIEGATRK